MASTSGTSVLPTAIARRPEASNMAVTMVVTVVLPSVPVTATTGRSSHAAARSNSLSTGTPARSAIENAAWRSGTPGLGSSASTEPTSSASSASVGASIRSTAANSAALRAAGEGWSSTTTTAPPRAHERSGHGPSGDPEPEDEGPPGHGDDERIDEGVLDRGPGGGPAQSSTPSRTKSA